VTRKAFLWAQTTNQRDACLKLTSQASQGVPPLSRAHMDFTKTWSLFNNCIYDFFACDYGLYTKT